MIHNKLIDLVVILEQESENKHSEIIKLKDLLKILFTQLNKIKDSCVKNEIEIKKLNDEMQELLSDDSSS